MVKLSMQFRKLIALWVILFCVPTLSFADEDALKLEIFVSEPSEINVTSALIIGPTEMMVVSAQGTKSAANRLANTIGATGKKLKYVFLTHPHLDHSQGAGILLKRFPEAKFIATPEVASLQRLRMEPDDEMAQKRHKSNAAVPSIPAEDYTDSTILIDGHRIEIWKDIIGDAGIGYPDEPHAALYVPSLEALMPSDVVYFNAHVMLGGSSIESRNAWSEQLRSWLDMDLDIVVPGHMLKTELPKLTGNGALEHTYQYITFYNDAIKSSENANELIAKMKKQYPDMQHQSALYLGSFINFREMHRLTWNPTVEKVAEYMPDFLVNWLNQKFYESAVEKYNHRRDLKLK